MLVAKRFCVQKSSTHPDLEDSNDRQQMMSSIGDTHGDADDDGVDVRAAG